MVKFTLRVRDLKSYYFIQPAVIKAVDGVSFKIEKGEALGIIGESGSGKSTIALSIMRGLPYPGKIVSGEIFYEDKNILELNMEEIRKIRGKNISIIAQSAMNSLDPLMRVGHQITEAILVHEDIDKNIAVKRAEKLLDEVGIKASRFMNYPHELSGGMKQRIMIAMALACRPGLIIADEPTTALDVIVQAQILKLLEDLRDSMESTSIIFISHNLSVVVEICDNILIMYGGKMMEYANTQTIIKNPLHPYSKGLINSFPRIEEKKISFESIPGSPPDMMCPPKGCIFHPRCKNAKQICREETPEIVDVCSNHFVACHLLK